MRLVVGPLTILACSLVAVTCFPAMKDAEIDEHELLRQLIRLQSEAQAQPGAVGRHETKLPPSDVDRELEDGEEEGDFWEEWMKQENSDSRAWNAQNRLETRQHWSDRYRPGGKRNDPYSNGMPMVFRREWVRNGLPMVLRDPTRQHWSDWWRPGGKKYVAEHYDVDVDPAFIVEELKSLLEHDAPQEISNAPVGDFDHPFSRQHWSFQYRPGGKRLIAHADGQKQQYHDQQQAGEASQHVVSKRQHWSTGLSPGGKRSVDLSDFDESGHRYKRDGGMSEAVFRIEQPKPGSQKPVEKAEIDQQAGVSR